MALFVFVLAVFVAGHGALAWIERDDADRSDTGPVERAAAIAILGVAVAVAVSWGLALPRLLAPWSLVVVSIALLAARHRALRTFARGLTAQRDAGDLGRWVFPLVALAPVIAWIAFVMWRSTIVPVVNHDALAYHMPKALQIARAHGFGAIDGPDARVASFPADFELLLADVIVLDGSDAITEWVGTLFYGLFGLLVAALAERGWGKGPHVLVAALLGLGMPIALLHSGAHKNDLMVCAFVVGAALFGARWGARGGATALVLTAVCVALAIGTKVNGVFVLVALAPIALWRWARDPSARDLRRALRWSGALIAIGLALGGIMYVMNLAAGRGVSGRIPGVGYGDWANAWMFPYLAFVRPFSGGLGSVWVPWTRSFWFWPLYDHYFSTWGAAYSVMLVALPFGVWRFRRDVPERSRERVLATIVVVITFALMLPVRLQRPVGFFEGLVRYTMFLPPILAQWTVVPAARVIANRAKFVVCGVIAACSVLFAFQAVACAHKDTYVPIAYIAALLDHPELARVPYDFNRRAAHVVDAMAGPEDHVAFDGGFSSFAYPAYGADLRRTVTYLHPAGGVVAIPDDAQWIVIDRAWNALFNNPAFTDFGKWRQYILKGTPTPEDMVVFDQVSRDPRFELVYRDPRTNQAVFRRR